MGEEVATKLEGWLYGCDICQDVCPWNQMTPATDESRFEPREGNINASLSEILELTPETYAARFRRSAMKRAKLSGLQRNARALLQKLEHGLCPVPQTCRAADGSFETSYEDQIAPHCVKAPKILQGNELTLLSTATLIYRHLRTSYSIIHPRRIE